MTSGNELFSELFEAISACYTDELNTSTLSVLCAAITPAMSSVIL